MEDVKVRLAELVKRGLPLTGTSAYLRNPDGGWTSPKSSKSNARFAPSTSSVPPDSNSNPKVLTPLNYPAIINGTLNLPKCQLTSTSSSNSTCRCPYNNCFQFSDGSAIICCDILDFDARMIGKEICVLSWNFIPWRPGGGFFEIIKWKFRDLNVGLSRCSNADPFLLSLGSPSSSSSEDSYKARYCFLGVIDSVSQVTTVPCSNGKGSVISGDSRDLRGFFVQVTVCQCIVCSSRSSVVVVNDLVVEHDFHSFVKSKIVYFCGSASSWYPVITKLIGSFVKFLSFMKKLVFYCKEESCLMYVSAEKSALGLYRLSKKCFPLSKPVIKGQGECGTYTGVVKGVYMHGMVLELDSKVWLLLTDQLLTPPHSLRVGSVVTVRNVHFVNPRFSWMKSLVLGACVKTGFFLDSFSPLETGCHILSHSASTFWKFIESLPFSARLWALLVVSSFRKKFAGILSEKRILGSKHKEGLAQFFASSHIPLSLLRSRNGVLMELYKHDSCGVGSETCGIDLKAVVTVSCFIQFCEIMWTKTSQLKTNNKTVSEYNHSVHSSCEGKSFCPTVRKIYESEDIGIALVGNLKISQNSGRLQLVDATGSIDVHVPDLPSSLNANSIYEVVKYSLVVEGTPQLVDQPGLLGNDFISGRSFFQCISLARDSKLAIFVHFHFRNAACRSMPFFSSIDWRESFEIPPSGVYHLLQVTHKFPLLQKIELQGDPMMTNTRSMFVECVIFSWNLFLAEKDGVMLATKLSTEQLMEGLVTGNCEEHPVEKKRRIDHASREIKSSVFTDNSSDSGCGFEACSDFYDCVATVRSLNFRSEGIPAVLFNTRGELNSSGVMPSAQRVLLEFEPKSFYSYQLLQIGNYYMMKHHREDPFCNLKDSACLRGLKILVIPGMHLWNVSFASDEDLLNRKASKCNHFDHVSFDNSEVLTKGQIKLCPRTSSDVCVHYPANLTTLLEVNVQDAEDHLIKRVLRPNESGKNSLSVWDGPPESNCLFPEGNLQSMRGHVVAFHNICHSSISADLNCQNLGDGNNCNFFPGVKCSSCIHLLVDNNVVKIFGSLVKRAFPIGLGPGVNATFYRILELGNQRGFMLTPVSSIVIKSIRVSNQPTLKSTSHMDNKSKDIVYSGLISEMIRSDGQPMRVQCRVVAVNMMVLEKNRKCVDSESKVLESSPFHIQLASFMLDDGSSTGCCWTSGERAATLLRLHELLPWRASRSSGFELKWVGIGYDSCSTIISHLEKVFENNDRIIVKRYGSMLDSSYQDFNVSVTSDNALSNADENLFKFIIFNACLGTIWTVTASVMDSNAVGSLLKEHIAEMEMTLSLQHIWAREVCCTNTLAEARKTMLELVHR